MTAASTSNTAGNTMHSYSQAEPSATTKQTAASTSGHLLQLTTPDIICYFLRIKLQNCQSPKAPANTAQPHCAELLGGAGMDAVLLPSALPCCTLTSWDTSKNQAIKCTKTSTPCQALCYCDCSEDKICFRGSEMFSLQKNPHTGKK